MQEPRTSESHGELPPPYFGAYIIRRSSTPIKRATHVVEHLAEVDSVLDTGQEHLGVVSVMVVGLFLHHLPFTGFLTYKSARD